MLVFVSSSAIAKWVEVGKGKDFCLGTHTLWKDKKKEIAYMDLNVNVAQSRLWMRKKL
jgi:hypothetical protein